MNQSEEIKSAEAVLENAKNKYKVFGNGGDSAALHAMHEYANQFKSEWISVKDDKPQMGQDVICTDNHTCYSIGWYSDPEGFYTDKEMNVSHYMIFTPTPPKV
jgi:hypothetical protein